MFDGVDFPRQPSSRRAVNETAVSIAIVAFAMTMLFLPISLVSMVDIVRYVRGH